MPRFVLSTGPLDGGFAFDLWDGENLSPGHFFLIRAQREPVISLARKQSLTVCPGGYQHVLHSPSSNGAPLDLLPLPNTAEMPMAEAAGEWQGDWLKSVLDAFSRCPAAHHQPEPAGSEQQPRQLHHSVLQHRASPAPGQADHLTGGGNQELHPSPGEISTPPAPQNPKHSPSSPPTTAWGSQSDPTATTGT